MTPPITSDADEPRQKYARIEGLRAQEPVDGTTGLVPTAQQILPTAQTIQMETVETLRKSTAETNNRI